MSVRTMKTAKHDVRTDPRWYPVTRGLNSWVNRLAARNDLVVRVPKRAPAAAVFVAENGSVDIRESTIARIDPTMSAIDLLAKHPEECGVIVHETAHAAYSTMDLPRIARRYGARHTSVFLLLEEGRCESHLWPRLNPAEKAALSMMVPRFVLTNLKDDEDEDEADMTDPRLLVRLVGLLAARRHKGIVTDAQTKVGQAWTTLMGTLPDAEKFEALAVEFAETSVGYYSANEDTLHRIVRDWIALEDALPKPESSDEGESEDGDESEPGEAKSGEGSGGDKDESESESSDKDKGEDESESGDGGEDEDESDGSGSGDGSEPEPGEGQGRGRGESDDDTASNDTPDDGIVGDDDQGVVGAGDQHDSDGEGDGALGEYNSIDPDTVASIVGEIVENLRESMPEAKKVHGSRLGVEVRAAHKATARDHEQRRRDNKAAITEWRKRR